MPESDITKLIQDLSSMPNADTRQSRNQMRQIFTYLFNDLGYKPYPDSMRRHPYLEYIAKRGSGSRMHSIGATRRRSVGKMTKDEAEDLAAGCTIDGISKVIVYTEAGPDNDSSEYDIENYPVAIELMTSRELFNWVERIEAEYDEKEMTAIVKSFTYKLIEKISKDRKFIDQLEWRDLERTVAEVFNGMGFDVELTPSAKDGGKDIIVFETQKNGSSYIIEIKHWRSGQRVGNSALKEFVKVIAREKRKGGLYLATHGYVDDAIESLSIIERKKVKFGEDKTIHALCNMFMKHRAGIWEKDQSLTDLLMIDTI